MGRTARIRRKRNLRREKLHEISDDSKEFIENIRNLCAWLGQLGWKNETFLAHKCYLETGRGLYSKKSIKAGDLLIRIPFNGLINSQTIENDKEFCEIFTSNLQLSEEQKITFQSLLSVFMLYHSHLGEFSYYHSYINTIPKSFTNPYFCSRQELLYIPENVLEMIVKQNQLLKTDYTTLNEIFVNIKCNCCNRNYFPDILTFEKFKWAYFAVNSRCVYFDPDALSSLTDNFMLTKMLKDEPKLALCPYLDFINHSDTVDTAWKLSKIENEKEQESNKIFYELYTETKFNAYDQIFISYGKHSNQTLLINYGFFLKSNHHELFEFHIKDIENLIHSNLSYTHKFKNVNRNKFKFIKDHNLNEQMFISLNDNVIEIISYNLQIVLYIIFKCESHFTNVLNQIAFGVNHDLEKSVSNECKALITYKIGEYEKYVKGLNDLDELTESGKIVLDYMKECICYLTSCLEKI